MIKQALDRRVERRDPVKAGFGHIGKAIGSIGLAKDIRANHPVAAESAEVLAKLDIDGIVEPTDRAIVATRFR